MRAPDDSLEGMKEAYTSVFMSLSLCLKWQTGKQCFFHEVPLPSHRLVMFLVTPRKAPAPRFQ